MMEHVTLEDLASRYDSFFIDQFGVLIDGTKPYPGAPEALAWLKSQGKTVVILSNSGRSGEFNSSRLVERGFDASSFDHFITSGDAAYHLVADGQLGLGSGPLNCLTISSGGDRNLSDRLDYRSTEDAAIADVLVISGSQADTIGLGAYRERLRPAAKRGVVCICTNPDIQMLTGTGLAPAAGAIAALYEEMGGIVHRVGKPFRPIYDYAQSQTPPVALDRIVAIGDSIDHDIAGANGFGIACALVRTGIVTDWSLDQIRQEIAASSARVNYLLERFA
jgi:HAD superfamily hydrolase (TIGR01459 family)